MIVQPVVIVTELVFDADAYSRASFSKLTSYSIPSMMQLSDWRSTDLQGLALPRLHVPARRSYT